VVIDPLYLAAAGARGADLYEMGDVLGGIQRTCQDARAALAVVTHWNKTGLGKGVERFTGVGPGAWGRVLASAAVEDRRVTPDGASEVELQWAIRGSEIPEIEFAATRRVWSDDPESMASPLHYRVDVSMGGPGSDGLTSSQRRVLRMMVDVGEPVTIAELRRLPGSRLTERTAQRALKELLGLDLVDSDRPGPGLAARWWPTAG
jgi:hypothetical protein